MIILHQRTKSSNNFENTKIITLKKLAQNSYKTLLAVRKKKLRVYNVKL